MLRGAMPQKAGHGGLVRKYRYGLRVTGCGSKTNLTSVFIIQYSIFGIFMFRGAYAGMRV